MASLPSGTPGRGMSPGASAGASSRGLIGGVATLALGVWLVGFSLSIDFPTAASGFHSDEATYYMLGYSLARDFDFTYERNDLERVWEEFPSGPEGVFLKRGRDVEVGLSPRFPFVEWRTRPDPDTTRLYYGKAYVYPLVAAPFVRVFGTNGFLLLHALLLTGAFGLVYLWLSARAGPWASLLFATAFFVASVVPVYFVWISPELFNTALVCYALFLWAYKEVAPATASPGTTDWLARVGAFLRAPASDYLAAALVGLLAYSKPTHAGLMLPLVGLPVIRSQWRRAVVTGAVFLCATSVFWMGNVAITGELNYQGGERKTFYGGATEGVDTGFPFLTPASTFDTVGRDRGTDQVLTNIVFTTGAVFDVFRHNLWYFLVGRHTGLVPYFLPGVLSALLFLAAPRRRPPWQWLVLATIVCAALVLLLWLPFSYSGGGAPIGNRYFLTFYPLFLFLTPPLGSVAPGLAALTLGGLFTAQLVLNPFYTSTRPAEHPKSGPFRLFPVELSLLNDLPVNVTPSRVRLRLAGDPVMLGYFLDNNAYDREGEWFWVRGRSRAELILRGGAELRTGPDGGPTAVAFEIAQLRVEVRAGAVANQVVLETGASREVVELEPYAARTVTLRMPTGFPYRASPEQPISYLYTLSIDSETGFTPMFAEGSTDSRFLGAFVHLVPEYVR